MRTLTFLICLIPVIAFAQYPTLPNKVRLGYQTTADGLVWRGVAADTSNTPTGYKNFSYLVLDTVNVTLFGFVQSQGRWQDIGGTNSVVDSTRIVQDSIAVYYQGGSEVGRDTIRLPGGGSTEEADGLTILGDGSGGDPFRVDTTLLITKNDTLGMLANYSTAGELALKLNIADTATMNAAFLDGGGSSGNVAYWTGAKTLAADASQLYWDAANNRLGIGTSSPASILDAQANAAGTNLYSRVYNTGATGNSVAEFRLLNGHGTDLRFGADNAGAFMYTGSTLPDIRFFTNTSQKAVLKADGKFGLGVTSPSYTFSMTATDGLGVAIGTTAQRPTYALTSGVPIRYNTTDQRLEHYSIGSSAYLSVLSGSLSKIYWDEANGRLGLGTTSPPSILDAQANAAGTNIYSRVYNTGATGNSVAEFRLLNGHGADLRFGADNAGTFMFTPSGSLSDIRFFSHGAEKMRIKGSNSRVGILKSSPDYTLSINATDAIGLPIGTTAQRPTVVTASGQPLRYNTDSIRYEGYDGSAWKTLAWKTDAGGTGLTDGDKGDITVSASGTVWDIDAGVVGPTEIASTAVTAGSYTNASITVDADGRLTAASSGGSSVTGSGSANHIAYWSGTSTLTEDASQLYWDATNNRLGIGNAAPSVSLHVTGEARITDLVNGTPTALVGSDANGNLGTMVTGLGIAVSSGSIVTDFSEYTTVAGVDSADFVAFRDVSAGGDRKAKPIDIIKAADGHIYASNSSVNLISTGLFTDNREVFIWATLTSGASNNATFTIPDPSATYLGRKIYINSDDDSGTYKIIVATANPGGFYYSLDLVTAPSAQDSYDVDAFAGYSTFFVCMQKSTSYYWVPFIQ